MHWFSKFPVDCSTTIITAQLPSTVPNINDKNYRHAHVHWFSSAYTVNDFWSFFLMLVREDGGIMFLRNVGKLLPDYAVSHPRSHRRLC
jgi:hypothetical protein